MAKILQEHKDVGNIPGPTFARTGTKPHLTSIGAKYVDQCQVFSREIILNTVHPLMGLHQARYLLLKRTFVFDPVGILPGIFSPNRNDF